MSEDGLTGVLLAMPSALRTMAENAEQAIATTTAARVAELEDEVRDLASQVQRKDDLIAELRRQMRSLERQAERGHAAEQKLHRVALVRVWTNEDRKQFMFADDIRAALGIPS